MNARRKRARAIRQAKAAGRNAGLIEAAAVVLDRVRAYPPDIFLPPPPGKHGKTVAGCSAAALRAVLPGLAGDIRARVGRMPQGEGLL